MACMRKYSIVINIKQSPILFLVKEKTNVCCHKSQFLLESRRTRHAPKIYLVEKENIINSHIQSDSIFDCFLWALSTGAGTNGKKKTHNISASILFPILFPVDLFLFFLPFDYFIQIAWRIIQSGSSNPHRSTHYTSTPIICCKKLINSNGTFHPPNVADFARRPN